MTPKDLLEKVSEACDLEALTVILSINSDLNTEDIEKIKSRLLDLSKIHKLKVNPLPNFPHVIIQAEVKDWQILLNSDDETLDNINVSLELNKDIAFIPSSESQA